MLFVFYSRMKVIINLSVVSCWNINTAQRHFQLLFILVTKNMQSAYSLGSEVVEQDKIEKLSLKLSRWRLITFAFLGLALVLTIGLALVISSKVQPYVQQTSSFTSEQMAYAPQACSIFLFNQTNLTEFTWRMEYNTSQKSQSSLEGQSTKVKSLNVSYNLLKKFSDNSLPDLEQLKLFSYKVYEGYYYDTVSNNKFPKLQNLTIPRVGQFSNNYLPALVNFQQYSFFYLKNFDNNYMPTLNGSRNFFKANSITGNTLGLQGLRYDTQKGFKFQNNTFNELKSLQIYCWGQMDRMPANQITNNTFSKLQNLCIDCNIQDFNQSKKFQTLKGLVLSSGSIKTFDNNVYPELTQIYFETYNLKTFTNNHLPLLKQLHIESSQLTNFCQGNHMPKLKNVELFVSTKLKSIECLREAQQLEILRLFSTPSSIENFNLPKLKILYIGMGNGINFSNNSFSSIESASINDIKSFTSFQKDKIAFGNTLEYLLVRDSSLQELSFSTDMPNLTKLYVVESKLTSVNCTTFRNVKELFLSSNSLKDDVIDTLIDCNFKNPSNIYLQDNQIVNRAKGLAKLSSKYPNCYISL